jgi:hypothetical protein
MTDIKILFILLCSSLILNIISSLVISKLTKMLRWALPIIDQLYKERHGEEE